MAPRRLANKFGFTLDSLGPRSRLTSWQTREHLFTEPTPLNFYNLPYPYLLDRNMEKYLLVGQIHDFP